MCSPLTLKLCCQNIFSCKNDVFWGVSITIAVLFGITASYFALIGYACLWSTYVWSHISPFSTSCNPFQDPVYFWFMYVFLGVADVIFTGFAIFFVVAVVGGGGYLIYLLGKTCVGCCRKSYERAQEEERQIKTTEKAPLLRVNVTD